MASKPFWTAIAALPLIAVAGCDPMSAFGKKSDAPAETAANAPAEGSTEGDFAAAVRGQQGGPATAPGQTGHPSIRDIEIPHPLGGPSGSSNGGPTPSGSTPTPTTATDEAAMARAVMANPSGYDPVNYVYVTKYLWERGDRQQAAFWHYLFQIRTAPWLPYDPRLAPLRSGVNASIGQAITEWIGADWDVFVETTARAMSYERRLPLWSQRPAGVSESQWRSDVAAVRATWDGDYRQMTGSSGSTKASIDARRRQNGLYVGPLQNRGAPLPNDWR